MNPPQMMIGDNSSVLDINPWNKLDDVMVECVLAKFSISDIFFNCQVVCKRWSSVIHSPTFSIARIQLSDRCPWFLIFDIVSSAYVAYDTEVCDWRRPRVQYSKPFEIAGKQPGHPFVASAGLVCFFQSGTGSLIVCNPFLGLVRSLPVLCMPNNDYVRGFALHVSGPNYKVFVTYGRWPNLGMKVFSSEEKKASWVELPLRGLKNEYESWPLLQREMINNDNHLVQMKGVTVTGNEGQVLVFFLILNGILVCFDTRKGTFLMYPRLLEREHISADLVECGGRVFLVVLMEPVLGQPSSSTTERRTLRVWVFNNEKAEWKHISAMPTNMSKDYDFEAQIICSGYGNYIMACVNSIQDNYFNQVVVYNIQKNTWVELSPYFDDSNRLRIVWAYCFMPDFETKV
ncbi:hypothetical protein BVC80_911g3 [Macleaya cordata]|uniref:F-box domain n=1 Tax=Macleaya cordata TaxID=56857 RepID=A0A200QIZ1_MACCD|nr:hypothetical protein BVC80_911g3 [Macleaya cordata]